MRTADEIDAKVRGITNRMNEKIDMMNRRIADKMKEISVEMAKKELKCLFEENNDIEYYKWSQEYSWQPGRICFASVKPIWPGTQAYKGTKKFPIKDDHGFHVGVGYPEEIWLSKGEFTMRRLKGQL